MSRNVPSSLDFTNSAAHCVRVRCCCNIEGQSKETLNVERVCVATVCKSTGGISPEGNNMHVKKDLELTCWASINCLKGRQ